MRFYRRSFKGQTKSYTEQAEQEQVARHLNRIYPSVLWTATVGGVRLGYAQRIKLKSAGYRKGCPDILIFEPKGDYKALMIELKRPKYAGIKDTKGSPTPEQLDFLRLAGQRGYLTAICYGSEEAIGIIDKYLAGLYVN